MLLIHRPIILLRCEVGGPPKHRSRLVMIVCCLHLLHEHSKTYYKCKFQTDVCVFQAACITQQSCTLAVTPGTPIQLEDLTEGNGPL